MEFLAALHPKIVHFPLAFLLIYVLLEIIGVLSGKVFFQKCAYLFLFIGVISAVAAVITGNQAADIAERLKVKVTSIPSDLISEHEDFATASLWYFTALLILRTFFVIKKKYKGIIQYVFIILTLIGGYLIYQTGDRGGKLVFNHGVGTVLRIDTTK
jgi:uncharacterized membrane protein